MPAPTRRRALIGLAAALSSAGLGLLSAPTLQAQVPPLLPTTTTTTAPAGAPTTTAPSGSDFSAGANEAPPGAEDAGGDGAAAPASGIRVPPDAQRIIDGVRRSGPSDNDGLLAGLVELQELGLSEAEAQRVGLGRFPIAGSARYSHDWLYPRYGPGFRFHLGTDVFAAYGTPVRAPVDGVARHANSGLGGLTVKVVMPDGTYFYLAHLSGLAEGFTDGMAVHTGDIVGYVGDSGNARGGAPHLHIGIYPHGGSPIDPKPVLDQFLAEAEALLPQVVAAYERSRPTPDPLSPPATSAAQPRSRRLLAGTAWPAEVRYLAGAHPLAGPHVLIDGAVADIVAGLDWEARAADAA